MSPNGPSWGVQTTQAQGKGARVSWWGWRRLRGTAQSHISGGASAAVFSVSSGCLLNSSRRIWGEMQQCQLGRCHDGALGSFLASLGDVSQGGAWVQKGLGMTWEAHAKWLWNWRFWASVHSVDTWRTCSGLEHSCPSYQGPVP